MSDSKVRQFRSEGFVKGSRVLSDHEVGELRDEIQRVIRDHGKPGPQPVLCHNLTGDDAAPVWQIVNIWQASEPFRRLVNNRTILEEIQQLNGAPELRLWHDQIQYKAAGKGGVNMWHQDAPYWPILRPMTQVTAWVALDEVDESNGCMSMVPGTHLLGNTIDFLHTLKQFGDMPREYRGKSIEVRTCPVGCGQVHYHHALTWHGSHANTSDRPRRAIALHYMGNDTRYVAAGQHVMKQFVEVADGEMLQGKYFPKVWPS